MKLPVFNEYWNGMDINNKKILNAYKKLEEKWLNNKQVDIGLNFGYLSLFVNERNLDFYTHKNVEKLIEDLQIVITYPIDDLEFYPRLLAEDAIEDAYLISQDYDKYWEVRFGERMKIYSNKLQKILWFQDIYNYYLKCSNPVFDGKIFLFCVGVKEAKLTEFGRGRVSELVTIMNSYVEDFIEKEGLDPFHYFFRRYAEKPLSHSQADELKQYLKPSRFAEVKDAYYFVLKLDEEEKIEYEKWVKKDPSTVSWKPTDFATKKEYIESYNKSRSDVLFRFEHKNQQLMGTTREGNNIYVPFVKFHQFIYEAFEGFCNQMLRTCENILRKKKNLPEIGEGWIGETTLYYLIKDSFSNEEVINHGKPIWLGRQHLDIYFPIRNIAIEYQGEQHDRPVAFFGGEESFKEQKKRDERKALLCKENGCKLIYVRKGYKTSDVLLEIENELNRLS